MRALARIVAEADERGTVLTRLRGEPPLLLRQTGPQTVHLVGGAAGPLGGDELQLDIEVGPGATLFVRTVAASIALPGPKPSRMQVNAVVGAGGSLYWLPEQLVAASKCRHAAVSNVDVANGASLIWRDELICGRHGEATGEATMRLSATYAGRPLLRQTLAVGLHDWASPAVLGGASSTGSLLQVNGELCGPAVLGPGAVRSALTGPATLTTAVAPDAHRLRELLKVSGP
jgi:urease accessory protein